MFQSRKLNERNKTYERTTAIVYKDIKSLFQELLIKDNYLNIHHRNMQKLVT